MFVLGCATHTPKFWSLFSQDQHHLAAIKLYFEESPARNWLSRFNLCAILVATLLVYSTESHLANKQGLPFTNQLLSWTILGSSVLFLVIQSQTHKLYIDILVGTFVVLSSSFILLSISYEVLFYCALFVTLILWVVMEIKLHESGNHNGSNRVDAPEAKTFGLQDIRSSLFYMFFSYVGFFGTGNIASISSFEISSTYRFTTIFDPFLMAALLLWKVIIPFLLVGVVFRILNRRLNIAESGSFFAVVAFSDVMSLNFFFLVKDYGSWKDIGTSISHFGIANGFIVVQLLLFGITQLLIKNMFLTSPRQKIHAT